MTVCVYTCASMFVCDYVCVNYYQLSSTTNFGIHMIVNAQKLVKMNQHIFIKSRGSKIRGNHTV